MTNFVQMWKDFLKNKEGAVSEIESFTLNPFIPEFKKLWLEFLKMNGLMKLRHKHIRHEQFVQMWHDFLAERGENAPGAVPLDTAESDTTIEGKEA